MIRIRILLVYVPTGTKKFLSVEQIIASTRPTTQARFKSLQVCSNCNPYALLITWCIVYRAHNLPISSIESGTRGAKHDVVLIIANTRVEYCSISSSIACISVTTWSVVVLLSSSNFVGTTIQINPALCTALKQLFWSILFFFLMMNYSVADTLIAVNGTYKARRKIEKYGRVENKKQ